MKKKRTVAELAAVVSRWQSNEELGDLLLEKARRALRSHKATSILYRGCKFIRISRLPLPGALPPKLTFKEAAVMGFRNLYYLVGGSDAQYRLVLPSGSILFLRPHPERKAPLFERWRASQPKECDCKSLRATVRRLKAQMRKRREPRLATAEEVSAFFARKHQPPLTLERFVRD